MSEALLIAVIGYAAKYGIPAAFEIIKTWRNPDATIDDLIAAFDKISDKSYEDYIAGK